MISLRVYIGTDRDIVFDFLGKKNVVPFHEYTILPIVKKRTSGSGNVITKFYSEAKLMTLPLRVKPCEAEIRTAEAAIIKHPTYLDRVPVRLNRYIPAEKAADYAFGWCVVYAAALEQLRGIPATAINVSKYDDQHGNQPGFCHSVIIHPDGEAEDSWGKQPLENILERYGILEYTLSEETQKEANEQLQMNSGERYKLAFNEALELIKNNDALRTKHFRENASGWTAKAELIEQSQALNTDIIDPAYIKKASPFFKKREAAS